MNLFPDYVFECSWEVCNKVGGIYTVLSSKALTLTNKFTDNYLFIGPDLNHEPGDFEEDRSLFSAWKQSLPNNYHIKTGRWLVPGKPVVILISFKTFFDKRDSLYYDMWDTFGVDSLKAYNDYDEACIFAWSTGLIIESFYNFHHMETKNVAALFNEWMLCMGALYVQKYVPAIATLFTTHATTTGRSIAGNNKPLYSHFSAYNGSQMAKELNVEAKHSLEKQTALHVDCFTTVSGITAIECKQMLGKAPDVVTPNGFDKGFVPEGEAYLQERQDARTLLLNVAEKLLGRKLPPDTFLVATSGRYEYRNKGLDVFIEAMNRLRQLPHDRLKRDTIAFIMVPAWVYAARADLKYCIKHDYQATPALQMPFLTHWIQNMDDDKIISFILSSGFNNSPAEKLSIIYVPCYLDGHDEIFNKSYYDLLIGMDATVFASYYEPWGYTPLESIAFGIPTITTDLAGFGVWAKTHEAAGNGSMGQRSTVNGSTVNGSTVNGETVNEAAANAVTVIHRTDDNYFDVIDGIVGQLLALMNTGTDAISHTDADTNVDACTDACTDAEKGTNKEVMRQKCFRLAEQAEWRKFISFYYEAFDIALKKAKKRNKINQT